MLERESDEGNVEYKLKLLRPSAQRFEQLVTQLKFRLEEGGGEALYEIGVADDGRAQVGARPSARERVRRCRAWANAPRAGPRAHRRAPRAAPPSSPLLAGPVR